jgi:hypothetical protein
MPVGRAAGLAAAVVLAVLGSGPVPVAAQPAPAPTADLSRFQNAEVSAGLSVVVERARERLVTGEDATYTIMARNAGAEAESVTIRVSLPPTMARVRPGDGGELSEDGYVRYAVTLEPDDPVALHLTGVYPPSGTSGAARVALTACAMDGDGQPIICATDLADVGPARRTGLWLLLAAAITVAVAAAAGVAHLRWRHRSPASA